MQSRQRRFNDIDIACIVKPIVATGKDAILNCAKNIRRFTVNTLHCYSQHAPTYAPILRRLNAASQASTDAEDCAELTETEPLGESRGELREGDEPYVSIPAKR